MTESITRRFVLQALPMFMARPMLFGQTPTSGRVLFGTGGKVSRGIYTATWQEATGELGPLELAAQLAAPTFLAFRGKTNVYAVSEVNGEGAAVTAFAIQRGGAALQKLNSRPAGGDGPTHLSVSPDGRVLAVANYTGGSVTSYRVEADGSLSSAVSHFQYTGHGPDPSRQQSPHAHSAHFSPDGRFLLVNDLGLDRIAIYRVDAKTGALTANQPPAWIARPGTGPRHIAFHPNGKWLYSVDELDSSVDILQWDAVKGTLRSAGHVSTLESGFPLHKAFAGEIGVSADGRNLYVGNRVGADTIAVFRIERGGASLSLEQLAPNGGKNTRHFAISPSGRWLLLCDQGSNEVVVLARDPRNGKLSEPRHRTPLDTVMFAGFVPQ